MKEKIMATMIWGFVLACATSASSATLVVINSFDTASDYDRNFWELRNGADVAWNAGGFLEKSTTPAAPAVLVYDTAATGGVGGAGGTAGANTTKFEALRMSIDFRITASVLAVGGRLGMYYKVNDAETSGYAAMFDFTDATTARLLFFDSNSDPSSGGVGTQRVNANFTTTGSFALNTYYRAYTEFYDQGGNVHFSFKLLDTANNQIGSTISYIDTTTPVTGPGQFAFRLAGEIDIDNFAIEIIPEPGTLILLGMGMGGLMWLGKRSNRRS